MDQHTVPAYGESSQSRFENLPPLFKTMQGKKKAKKTRKLPAFCVFCKNNNESESVYGSHVLKDPEGKVVCPALYIYKCPICNNTGHDAHTVKHCPYNPEQLRRQTELAEIWRSYRETKEQDRPEDSQPQQYTYRTNREMPDYNYGYQRTMTPLTNSSLYNIEANRHCQRQSLSTSFGSVSPASSCTSPLLSPNRSLFTSFPSSPTSSSPSYNFPTPPQAMSNNHLPNDENNILMENLLKLLQVSN
eukprot:TRINITY_DN23276_c0_g1_i1.p1 TRINITY_DN23276_c0_g1~~TRINITY_DN23276_c0_g1_i1.p1  ORF type:complete len:246 (-),score=59.36 TRINITY_DN23276_c0_g1_i1:455-1192(-)